jgi:hypothetical protein
MFGPRSGSGTGTEILVLGVIHEPAASMLMANEHAFMMFCFRVFYVNLHLPQQ